MNFAVISTLYNSRYQDLSNEKIRALSIISVSGYTWLWTYTRFFLYKKTVILSAHCIYSKYEFETILCPGVTKQSLKTVRNPSSVPELYSNSVQSIIFLLLALNS
jgi:hypothetical protein